MPEATDYVGIVEVADAQAGGINRRFAEVMWMSHCTLAKMSVPLTVVKGTAHAKVDLVCQRSVVRSSEHLLWKLVLFTLRCWKETNEEELPEAYEPIDGRKRRDRSSSNPGVMNSSFVAQVAASDGCVPEETWR